MSKASSQGAAVGKACGALQQKLYLPSGSRVLCRSGSRSWRLLIVIICAVILSVQQGFCYRFKLAKKGASGVLIIGSLHIMHTTTVAMTSTTLYSLSVSPPGSEGLARCRTVYLPFRECFGLLSVQVCVGCLIGGPRKSFECVL